MSDPLGVMIVDDSAVYRRLLTLVMEDMPDVKVLGTAPTGPIAIKKIPALRPQVVFQDIEMPEMSGIEVLESIKAEYPEIEVVLVSGANTRSADIVVKGLSKGAADFIAKPEGGSLEENKAQLKRELSLVLMGVRARSIHREAAARRRHGLRPVSAQPMRTRPPGSLAKHVALVGIGISTGGPQALAQLVPRFPADLRVPVVIVQHMPPLFTGSLARSLDENSKVRVREAEDGKALEPGTVYIAPGGIHMAVARRMNGMKAEHHVALQDTPPINSCKPSVDLLFESIAATVGGRTLVVVMTGMGQDGMEGVSSVKRVGGYCVTQSEESCVIYGMPQSVDAAQLSDESVALSGLADRIVTLVG
ncbi:MAG: chemotaxis-specific protein-glutamate methyltransferase CheB [SAR324 cluster bacterium]|nr:chemotaxis-specific protein-glutamate methyltransferase CheB [SAR324 cluster bacterium]